MNAKRLVIVAPLLWALGSAPLAIAQTKNANPVDQKATGATVSAGARTDAKPIEDLQLAADRMRDAIHAMLKEPAGVKRAALIKAADRSLAEVERAMANLPPALLTAEVTESGYKDSADRLREASEDLNAAEQALAKDPDSKRRNETIREIKTSLRETHRLMHEFPPGA